MQRKQDQQNLKGTSPSVEVILRNKEVLETEIMNLIFNFQKINQVNISGLSLETYVANLNSGIQKGVLQKATITIGLYL